MKNRYQPSVRSTFFPELQECSLTIACMQLFAKPFVKTTISGLTLSFVMLMAVHSDAQLLQWNTFGNAGTETSEPSVFNAAGISAANLTQGAGVTPVANGNRFGGNDWFDAGDTNPTTLSESVSGNDYLEFIVTPVPGATYTPTSFDFVWDRSGTGPPDLTLRSSADGFTADLGTVVGAGGLSSHNITISGLLNLSTATTFRLYGYGATGASGTGGFDIASNIVNVALQGTVVCNVLNITASTCHTTLQSAINAASPGDVLELTGDLTEGQVTIDKAVTIDGNGFTLTSTSGNYGVEVDDPNITILDLKIEDAGTFGLQINCGSDNLVLTNVIVDDCGGTGVGLNGSDNVVITNLTSTNNTGNGISITDCDNTVINGITTSGNAFVGGFSAGIGLFTSGVYCPPAGVSGFTLNGTVSITEPTKMYSQKANAAHVISGVSGSSIAWAVGVGALDRSYWPDKITAYSVVDVLFEPPYSYPNTLVYVAEVATENFYVDDDPAGDATPPMLVQTAVNFEVPGKTIFLEAGSFNERVVLDKSLTLDGSGVGTSTLDGTGLAGTGNGITINNGITNVTIRDLTVRDYAGANGNANAGIYAIGGNNNLTVLNADLADNVGGSGFYANGPIDNVLIDNVDAHGHTTGARGIVIWNGHKSNITITNCEVYNNNCCGIELQDGSSSAVNISDNYVHDNADNGIGIVGMDGTTGSNLVEDNTLVDNGRFGIEIKNPNGNGSNIVVNSNDVSRTGAIGDLRDIAGIAVFRRGVLGGNVDVPKGVSVTGNIVSGYTQPSTSEGFGIVIEGISHTVTGNTVTGNDVGIQQQAGHTPYPGDGDQSNLADTYFGRGNSPMTCSNNVSSNTLSSNGVDTRNVSVGGGLVTNTNTSEVFCTIQSAINDANTVGGHTISVSAGTYNEDVVVNKDLTVQGAGIDQSYVIGPIGGGGSTFQVSASGVLIEGFTISRDGNNTVDWNNPNLNIPGIAIQGQTVDAEIRNNKIIGNRTGIDVNNSNDNNIHNNIITFNRTGLIFRNQTDNTLLNENEITDNWTVGIVFLDASSGSNVPVQSALNCSFNDNNISGNWYGDIVDRQTGGALPPPGSNPKDFECNWYGTVTPWVSTANSAEPGYAAQIPVAYGGTAVPPGGQPNILGPASANFDYISYLVSGTDADGMEIGFQPAMGACSGSPVVISSAVASPETCAGNNGSILVTFSGATALYDIAWAGPDPGSAMDITSPYNITSLSAGAYTITVTDDNGTTGTAAATVDYHPVSNTTQSTTYATIQDAVNAANSSDAISVCAGNYIENVIVNESVTITGAGIGLTNVYPAISDPNCGGAGGGSLCGGASNVFLVEADNVTISGLTVDGNNTSLTSGILSNGVDVDARNGIITNHNLGVINNLNVNNVETRNIFLRGIYASSGGTFTFSNNTVSNVAGNTGSIAMFNFGGSGSFTNNTVSNSNDGIASNWSTGSTYSGNIVTGCGSGIHTDNNGGSGGVADVIQNNSVLNSAANGYGIWVFAPYRNVQVLDNTVTNVDVGLANAGQQAAVTVSFLGNTVDGMNKPNSTGVYQTTSLFGFGTADVTGIYNNNFIRNNTDAFYLEYEPAEVNTITVNNNSITGNTNGVVLVNTGGTLTENFQCNWWGSAAAASVASAASASANFTPWLVSGTDDQPGTPGFQPVALACSGTPVDITSTSVTDATCATGGSIQVTFTGGTAPYDIAWTGGSDTGISSPYTITGLSAGAYGITVTDGNGSTDNAADVVNLLGVENTTTPGFFATIQAAIDAANPGDVLEVCASTYTENITVNKALTINGPNDGIAGNGLRGPEAVLLNCNIDVTAAGTVIIDGFRIYQTDNNSDVVLISGGTTATIQNCILDRDGITTGAIVRAITTSSGAGVKTIQNNLFTGDKSGGLFSGHKTWNSGMYVNGAASTINISNNYFEYCRTALNLDDFNSGISVSGNTLDSCGTFMSFGGVVPTNGQYVMGANDFKDLVSTFMNLSNVNPAFRLDITSSTLNGAAFNTYSLANLFLVESTMYHRGRSGRNGLVYYVANNQYVVSGLTTIQSAVNYAASGDIINVNNGTYNEEVTVNLPVTIDGGTSTCGDVVIEGGGVRLFGVRVLAGVQNVTLRDFKVQNTVGANAGIWAATGNNGLNIQNVCLVNTAGTGAILAQGPVNGITINGCEVSGAGVNGRGIVIWDGFKENITITNNNVHDIGGCCGIELQDGNASGVTMTGNTVTNTGDSGMSAVGLNGTTGSNTISNNMITNTGRFGLEIKNPDGNGSNITINNNQVIRSIAIVDARDIAGIAVFRRAVTAGNTDVPKGVTVTGNTVSGYTQPSNSEGFGIVIEGIDHTVTGNTISNNDVGLQQQSGHLPAPPADGDQNNIVDSYFGRGNTQMTCSNSISGNTFVSNGTDTRNVLVGGGLVTNTNTTEIFCSIQSAIDDAQTLNGHTLTVEAGTYNENVVVSKELTITGAGNGNNPATNTVLTPSVSCTGVAFTISAANVTIQNMYVTNYQDGVQLNGVANPTLNNLVLEDYCRYGVNFAGSLNTSVDILSTTIQRTTVVNPSIGIRAGTATGVDGLLIDNSTINGNIQGMFIAQNATPSAFNNITIQNSTISNNTQKGLYFEKLNNALLLNLTMDNNGTDATYGFNNGIDINLKYDDYSNITISNCDITNSGANGTAGDPQNAAAVAIKARDDAPSYNGNPASLDDVTVINNKITGPQNGIRFGEFGKVNIGPSNVTVEGNDLSHAFAHKAIIRRTDDNVNLVCNWHGSTSLPTILAGIADAGTGSTILSSILTSGGDANIAVGFQPSGTCGCPSGNLVTNTMSAETFCTIQAAINDPDTDPGDVLTVAPGTYIENIYLTKEVDLRGNNYGIDPNTGVRGPESIIVPYVSDPDPNSVTASVILYMDAAASGTSIDGFLFDGDNPNLTSIVNINGANIDAIEAISGYEGTGTLAIRNNIIRNLSYCGIDMYNYYNGGGTTSDNYITNNKIDNIAQSPYGIGVLIYNNFYAAVEDNVITRVRVGVQTGNFYNANTGPTASISNNDIESERRGIFHNLAYSNASAFTLDGNDITTVTGAANHLGISLSSLGGSVSAVVNNNDIDGAYAGIDFWNCTTTNTITVTGGTITNCDYGVVASNYDGYSSDANSGSGIISGVTITGSTVAAVHVKDNPLNSNNATIQLTINNDSEINGTGQLLTGVQVTGPDATAVIQGNDSSINGFAIGIDVDGGSATITNNHIYDNGIGIRFINGGTGNANTNNFYDVLPNGKDIEVAVNAGSVNATPDNWFAGSSFGVDNASPLAVDATDCYWDDPSGPGPVGPGTGANVSANVLYCPWLGDEPVAFGGTGLPSTSPVVTIGVSEMSGVANNDGTICVGASATLDATSAGAISYLWSTTETTPSIVVSPGTTTMYTVTVTFAGCTDDATVTITVDPLPVVSGPTEVCVGNTIQMMPSAGGTWMSSNSLVASIDNTGLVTGVAAGSVTFTFTDAATGCSKTTATVTVNPLPSATITAPEFAWENTGGYVASVPNAGVGATYNWSLSSGSISMGSGTESITITTGAAGTLTLNVTVTDANGCSSTDVAMIEVLPACLEIDFSDPVLLSPTQLLGYWYVDRYEPQIFAGQANAPDATPNTLHHGIDASDGQATAFYNTQGRKHDLIDGTQAIQIDLFIPADWSSTGRRMAGMWGTAFDAGNAVSAYPIIEFTSETGTPRFRGWESGTGTWVDIGLPSGFVYNNWVTLRIQLLSTGEFLYTILTDQGNLQYTTTTSAGDGSVDILNVILQGHNTTAGVTYDIYWDNFQSSTILTPVITAPAEVCAETTGNDASVTAYGGATYTWSIQGGTITSGQGTTDIEFTAGTGSSLTLSVLIETADCEVSISEIIVVNPLPDATITTAPVVVTGTPNNPASIPDAGGGASYVWTVSTGTITGGQGTSAILYTAGPVGPMTMNVTVTDGNGCISTGSFIVNVISVGPSAMQWVPDNSAHGSCGASTDCCADIICFGLEYTPGVTGNLTTYTTGFVTNCLGGFPAGMSPVNSNQSCVMTDNSFEINACALIDSVLFNSSGNAGLVPVVAGAPIIIHKVCFNLSAGDVIGIKEDAITNLSASVDLTGGGQYTEFPTYSTTNLSKPLPVIPGNGSATVECVSQATVPTPPTVLDYCGNPVPVALTSTVNTPDPIVCEGTRVYNFTYTDCAGETYPWSFTYTIDDNTSPTAPALPDINVECFSDIPSADINVVAGETDNCGGPVTVSIIGDDITSVLCDGGSVIVTRTYRLTDCAGNFSDITQAINVDDVTNPTASNPAAINVECFSDIPSPNPAVVTDEADNCDGLPTVSFVNDDITMATCDGATVTVTRTYKVEDCSGNFILVTQAINVDDVTNPTASNPAAINVECFSDIPSPNPAVVIDEADNCDGLPSVSFVSDDITVSACDGATLTVTRTYKVEDCSGNSILVTQMINVDDLTPPAEVGGPVPIASTVDCPLDAVPPANLPVVQDGCGQVIAPPVPTIGGTNTGGCTGTITYTYNYISCSGLSFVWVYTYTVDCDALTLRVFLEGPYNTGTNLMETDLNDNHVLPGQDKLLSPNLGIQLGAPFTPFGQPYNTAPWNYNGNTGMNFGDASAPGAPMGVIPYPVDVVDWVLVTIRKNGLLPANNHWTCAGWVHDDGEVTFPESCGAFSVDVMDNYYVLIQHRNHLGVLTPMPVDELCGGLTLDWDFTTSNSYQPIFRYGQAQVEPGIWAMHKANGEQISSINAISSPDRTTWRLLQNALGYNIGDYNMNASTTSGDETDWKDNQNKTSGIIFY